MFKYDQVLLAIFIGGLIALAAFVGFERGFRTALKLHEEAGITPPTETYTGSYSDDPYDYVPAK